MDLARVDLKLLVALALLAERSVTKAARRLGLAACHPAVSRASRLWCNSSEDALWRSQRAGRTNVRQYGRNGLTAAKPYFGALHHQPSLRPAGSFFADLMADFGPDAHEMINVLTLGVRLRLTADELDRPLSAYPSGASNIASMFKPSS